MLKKIALASVLGLAFVGSFAIGTSGQASTAAAPADSSSLATNLPEAVPGPCPACSPLDNFCCPG